MSLQLSSISKNYARCQHFHRTGSILHAIMHIIFLIHLSVAILALSAGAISTTAEGQDGLYTAYTNADGQEITEYHGLSPPADTSYEDELDALHELDVAIVSVQH